MEEKNKDLAWYKNWKIMTPIVILVLVIVGLIVGLAVGLSGGKSSKGFGEPLYSIEGEIHDEKTYNLKDYSDEILSGTAYADGGRISGNLNVSFTNEYEDDRASATLEINNFSAKYGDKNNGIDFTVDSALYEEWKYDGYEGWNLIVEDFNLNEWLLSSHTAISYDEYYALFAADEDYLNTLEIKSHTNYKGTLFGLGEDGDGHDSSSINAEGTFAVNYVNDKYLDYITEHKIINNDHRVWAKTSDENLDIEFLVV